MSSLWKIAAHWNRAPVGLAVDLTIEHVGSNGNDTSKRYQGLGGNIPCII